ncbi:hypothetical protein Scep_003005 [Stephania cephalantha]|uniref:Uncharacterized protein n=1 Tax=Stephania cephalantha TaxID=152367 RepID=A0AAP0Q6D4_9MAGN
MLEETGGMLKITSMATSVKGLLLVPAVFLIVSQCSKVAVGSPPFSAMFVFGDSLVDNGNNNNLITFAKSNYMPYGIDFYQGPTGRFCNGRTIIDFLGEILGIPYLPAYESVGTIENALQGVNYASAAGGILIQTGQFLVSNFQSTMSQLRKQMDGKNMSQYLAKSIVIMVIGSNDYINNYLIPTLYPTQYYYTPDEYAKFLIDQYSNHILTLYNEGLRKFLLAAIGPLGCIPNQLAKGLAPPGNCVSFVNEMVKTFNALLRSLVDWLNSNYQEAIFLYGNTYYIIEDILNDPSTYGFDVTDQGCCGIGRNQGQLTCLPLSIPCMKRNEYVFWDAFHPTESVNAILAKRAYAGPPSDCHPINLQKMAQI